MSKITEWPEDDLYQHKGLPYTGWGPLDSTVEPEAAYPSDETVSWSCSDCGETLIAPTWLDLRQCGECGEWQDVPDGSGLRLME